MNVKKLMPIFDWLPKYKKHHLQGDLVAGLTVGVMLIPQGMAYAMIAGLPPVYGLYASITPQIIYALFGTSRQLAVGPVAMDSLLVAAGIGAIATAGSENYIALAILLAFMMGVIQLAFGLFRMGFLVSFLSKPVISGFTSAAALIIGLNQLKHLIGVDVERSNNIFNILYEAISRIGEFNWIAIAIGVSGILIIKNVKKIHKVIPGALVAVTFGILVVYLWGLHNHSVKIVGVVPTGIPSFALPELNTELFSELFPIALTLALIAFMEAISVAKTIQPNHKGEYKIDANQELIGLGMGNIVGSLFSSYPTTGGFSRSAVNENAGAKTNLAAFISAGLIVMTLLFLTPLFYYLPKAILASIIMVAVFGLLDYKYPKYLWKAKREDFFMLSATFITTLVLGIQEGILAGVVVSLAMMIKRTTRPHVAELGRLPGSRDYRNVGRFKEIETRADTLVLRYDAQLYFANTNHFIEIVSLKVEAKGMKLKLIVFHFGSVSHIDATALQAIEELINDLNEKGVLVCFSGIIGPVRDVFKKSGFTIGLGEDKFFMDVQSAIDYYDQTEDAPSGIAFKRALQTDVFKESNL